MADSISNKVPYTGRFAPSPSGPLHLGSLVCALASFLDARAHGGKWLLRIEDIDPPREQAGAAEQIRKTLECHQLYWDGDLVFQSDRSEAYRHTIDHLREMGLVYPCNCTRARLSPLKGRYDGHCRINPPDTKQPCSLRLVTSNFPAPLTTLDSNIQFIDRFCGPQTENIASVSGDYIIHRKDGLFAYQLAVVVDDIDQGVTDIVRGDDLLDTTAKQGFLYRVLNHPPPRYGHIPVVVDERGNKLSKQNHAPAIDDRQPLENLKTALAILHRQMGVTPVAGIERFGSIAELLEWGVLEWQSLLSNLDS